MRKIILLAIASLFALAAQAQTENVGNFAGPTRTVHYQNGQTLATAWPIWTTRGVFYYQISTDTFNLNKISAYNETMNNKLLWVKSNGDVSAWIPNYLAFGDTATMLSPYLRKIDTTGHWAPKLPYLLSYTETDPLSVHTSDSAAMLAGYLRKVDTSSMLINYLRKVDTTNKWAPKLPYLLSYTETDPLSVHTSDSAAMLLPYLRKIDTTNRWAPKLPYLLSYTETDPLSFHISDTAARFAGYYRVSNPAGYISSITSGMVTTALGYTPVTQARTLTINGVAQDLSTNRTWTVGDILSSGSYANPTWITSLAWSKITGTPTTLSGYGITDGVTSSALTSALAGKENTITAGTTAQYWRGDKTFQTLNTTVVPEGTNLYYTDARARASISLTTTGTGAATYNSSTGVLNVPTPSTAKRIETYTGTTDASGNYTVTYSTPFSVTPDVQPQLQAGTTQQMVRITSSTTTGFTVNATNRATVTLLSVDVLLGNTTPLASASVGVLVTSR